MIRSAVLYTLPGGPTVDAILLHEVGEARLANLVYCPPDGTVGQFGASYELATMVPHEGKSTSRKRQKGSTGGSWKERS